MTTEVLTFDAFVARVADALDLEPEEMTANARFDEDLGLDSYDLVELLTDPVVALANHWRSLPPVDSPAAP